jgi:hypothetical protein
LLFEAAVPFAVSETAAVFLSPLDFGNIRKTSDIYEARCSIEEHPFRVRAAG